MLGGNKDKNIQPNNKSRYKNVVWNKALFLLLLQQHVSLRFLLFLFVVQCWIDESPAAVCQQLRNKAYTVHLY
jgi:hypothetical protein